MDEMYAAEIYKQAMNTDANDSAAVMEVIAQLAQKMWDLEVDVAQLQKPQAEAGDK